MGSRATNAAGTATTTAGFTLSETFAGGQLRQVCSGCVTQVTAAAAKTNKHLNDIPVGAMVTVSGSTNMDNAAAVTAAVAEATAAFTDVAVGKSPTRSANP